MPVISRFFGIDILMYYDDHNPPHFHAKYGDYKALIDINKARVLEGNLPSTQMKLVLAWAIIHKEELLEDWKLAQLMETLTKIEPLR
ncbi:MAG: DUF4160 domain-containing protein [Pseudobutyrivibrio ruminis]|jgi:hypothetical protein|uniref:DUF4160 domain-containing protein n=1 Tax=Pseudobutyrivibrio ruminis TaxID=46206 RepID=UPI0026ECBB7E|nr:DUF4160 domain-containing protein [Pseudobutyrivibrio ruminis]MBE5914024.1 DUF4160 domain-containing protein [Pseudobutyrivibrio ruminis]